MPRAMPGACCFKSNLLLKNGRNFLPGMGQKLGLYPARNNKGTIGYSRIYAATISP